MLRRAESPDGARVLTRLGLDRLHAAVWVFAVVLAVAVGLGAAFAVGSSAPTYQSQATLLIDQPQALPIAPDAGEVQKLSDLREKYVGLVFTRAVAGPVAEKVGLPVTQVAGQISAFAPGESLLIVTTGRASTPELAKQLAGDTAQQLVSYLDHEQNLAKIPAKIRIKLDVVTPADTAQQQGPSSRRQLTVGAAAGVLAFLATVLVAGRLRTPSRG